MNEDGNQREYLQPAYSSSSSGSGDSGDSGSGSGTSRL